VARKLLLREQAERPRLVAGDGVSVGAGGNPKRLHLVARFLALSCVLPVLAGCGSVARFPVGDRCLVGRGERARRAGRRPRPRLHDGGARRSFRRLALQLLRIPRRHTGEAAEPRNGGEGHRARLRAGGAHRFPGARFLEGDDVAGPLRGRDVRRTARLVEPQAAQRQQAREGRSSYGFSFASSPRIRFL
jgi:hypothetical protein